MGQYYKIVNLDKKQCLDPLNFGDGSKLREFGESSMGTLLALTALLTDGNGRGGGDLIPSRYNKEVDKYLNKKRKSMPQAETYTKLIGTWAGDRIVIAGDYADGLKFVEDATDEQLEHSAKEAFTEGNQNKEDVTLYHYAKNYFEDISDKILKELKDCNLEMCKNAW